MLWLLSTSFKQLNNNKNSTKQTDKKEKPYKVRNWSFDPRHTCKSLAGLAVACNHSTRDRRFSGASQVVRLAGINELCILQEALPQLIEWR